MMKIQRFLFDLVIFAFILGGCSQGERPEKKQEGKIKKTVLAIAENYASLQLRNPKKNVSETGVISLSDDQKKYIIDPSKIFIGLINEDSKPDAIISIISLRGNELDIIEHLVILNTNGKLMLIRSIESDMNILEVKDRVITAQIHTKPRNNPLYWCSSCLEIVKYRFRQGELEKI